MANIPGNRRGTPTPAGGAAPPEAKYVLVKTHCFSKCASKETHCFSEYVSKEQHCFSECFSEENTALRDPNLHLEHHMLKTN